MSDLALAAEALRAVLGLGPNEALPRTIPVWRDDPKKPCAGRLLGIGRVLSYQLAREGRFPVRVLPLDGVRKWEVSTVSLLVYLSGSDAEAGTNGTSPEETP